MVFHGLHGDRHGVRPVPRHSARWVAGGTHFGMHEPVADLPREVRAVMPGDRGVHHVRWRRPAGAGDAVLVGHAGGAVRVALRRPERESVRRRALRAEVMVYSVIAMLLFRQASAREALRCLMAGLRRVSPELPVRVSGKSSISRAYRRLGPQPFAALREACVRPLAAPSTAGAWYRSHRLIAIDGSSLSVADEEATCRRHFGLPGASPGQAGFPTLRLPVLMEHGTRAPLAWCGGPWSEPEMEQAKRLVPDLEPGMLMRADRYYGGFPLWSRARDRRRAGSPARRSSGSTSRRSRSGALRLPRMGGSAVIRCRRVCDGGQERCGKLPQLDRTHAVDPGELCCRTRPVAYHIDQRPVGEHGVGRDATLPRNLQA